MGNIGLTTVLGGSVDTRSALATIAHQTVTALVGQYAPLYTDAQWAANPGDSSRARFYTNIVVRGCTALADDPAITFRPYVRNGTYVGRLADTAVIRPRLKDAPTIKCQKTVNIGVAYTDYSAAVVDNAVGTYADLDALDTVANGDWYVIGGPVPFAGVAIDVTANVNTNAAVLTAEYWTGAAWAALANVTDGTILVATKTHSGDGQVSWDMPAVWATLALGGITAYWVRFSTSAAWSATVEVAEIDLLMPIMSAVDIQADGDAVMLTLASQDVAVTGTCAYSGTTRVSWR